MTRANAIRLVAGFDLLESLRSRKAIALLLLYLAGSLGGSGLFVRALHALQERLREQFGEGVNMKELMESPAMERVMTELAGDPETASAIVAIPPMALFYGVMAMTFVPLLVLLTSSDAISGDVSTGSVRYSLFRVDRASWAVGKLLGQTALMAVGVYVGALGCWLIGAIWLEGMDIAGTLWWMLRIAGRATIYSFSYLGVALCASQLTRSNARALLLGLLLMFLCSAIGDLLRFEPIQRQAPEVFGVLQRLFPNGNYLALWHPSIATRAAAMSMLIAIGLAFFALGFWRFAKRDA